MIIHFFTVEYEILQLSTNGHSFFHSGIRNFAVVYKWSFIFSQRNTKFYSCLQTVIHFFTAKYEILQLSTNGHSFFHSEIRNFTVVFKRSFVFNYKQQR